MADAEDKITAQNLQAELAKLSQEVPVQAALLTAIYEDIAAANAVLDETKTKEASIYVEIDRRTKEVLEREENDRKEHSRLIEENTTTKQQIADTRKNTKEAMKELSRINSQVLSASDELSTVESKLSTARQDYSELILILEALPLLRQELSKTNIARNDSQRELSTNKEQSNITIKQASEEVKRLMLLANEWQQKADKAQSDYKTYTDNLYTSMNDYQIVRSRLESVWKETFPELELPLN